jgi:hypothetical protein
LVGGGWVEEHCRRRELEIWLVGLGRRADMGYMIDGRGGKREVSESEEDFGYVECDFHYGWRCLCV